MIPALALAQTLVLALAQPVASAEASREAYLMGTRATLVARAASRPEALSALDALLRVLEDTEQDLSTWRDTPFNRLNRARPGEIAAVPPALCELMGLLSDWTRRTGGTFDPAAGPLLDIWGVQTTARVPSHEEIIAALPASRLSAWSFERSACTIRRPEHGRLDSGGFGKGEAIDRASAAAVPSAGWLIDLGGQIGVWGVSPPGGWRVAVAHPRHRSRRLFDLRLTSGSIATSGGSERDQRAGRARVGHIIDPRTGTPATFGGSVVVWNERGLVADILSTALYVMGPEQGLRWANAQGVSACFLIPSGNRVRVRASDAFRQRFPSARRPVRS